MISWLATVGLDNLFIPSPVFGELQNGVEKTRRSDPSKASEIDDWIDELAAVANILPAGQREFRIQSRLMLGQNEALFVDALIAAIAVHNGFVVVTRNVEDFKIFDVEILNPFEFRAP